MNGPKARSMFATITVGEKRQNAEKSAYREKQPCIETTELGDCVKLVRWKQEHR